MSSPLFLQQYPACLVHLIWMVTEMGGKRPYICCFVGCCFRSIYIYIYIERDRERDRERENMK